MTRHTTHGVVSYHVRSLTQRGSAIVFWNAISGLFFLAAVPYGNVAWRDMDPVAALDEQHRYR